jgi:hypothetical protein
METSRARDPSVGQGEARQSQKVPVHAGPWGGKAEARGREQSGEGHSKGDIAGMQRGTCLVVPVHAGPRGGKAEARGREHNGNTAREIERECSKKRAWWSRSMPGQGEARQRREAGNRAGIQQGR